VPHARAARSFDRCGRVVAGVVPGGREPTDVTAVTDQVARDDRSDAVHVGDRGVGVADRSGDALVERDEGAVMTADLVAELECESLAFLADRVGRPGAPQCDRCLSRRQSCGHPTRCELTQHRVQAADRTGAGGDELMMTASEQAWR
jgi:hypothetical protein